MDNEDPAPSSPGSDLMKGNKVVYQQLKSQVSYLIYSKEGQVFPGMVTKRISKKRIQVMAMTPSGLGPSFWNWPAKDKLIWIELDDIIQVIEAPSLNSTSRNSYMVKGIAKYW